MNLWVDVKASLMHVQLYEFFIRRIPKQIQIIASGSLLLERRAVIRKPTGNGRR